MARIRITLPHHLRTLAGVGEEVTVSVADPATLGAALEALEALHPVLRGTIRDHGTLKRRPFVRYYACREDFSFEPPTRELPAAIIAGEEPLMIIGAIAGG